MSIEEFISTFSKEWPIVKRAPRSVIMLVCAASALAFAVTRYLDSVELSSAKALVELKDAMIADYKDKLSGATPIEAKKRIDALETKLKLLDVRRLSPAQISAITNKLKNQKGNLDIAQDMGSPQLRGLVADFSVAANNAGWTTSQSELMGLRDFPPSGVSLVVNDSSALSPTETVVKAALEAAGVPFDVVNGSGLKLVLTVKSE
ncbi:hypothetical protein [Rhizobium lusitanum]|uniref:Uncharacterized protein n=1 Tax=Rhizobium lusitanum TaxID=293958 RepID=A0A7X0MFC2_9HYPH|nr:hypothetical protein [Rhizobium lusitanum]MBB6488361.1 hypothetical protein [Rhizobium lusitanum]